MTQRPRLAAVLLALVGCGANSLGGDTPLPDEAPRLAQGAKVGEVTPSTAVLWTRLGAEGDVRVRYACDGGGELVTAWTKVTADTDFATQLILDGLRPGTDCRYTIDARNAAGSTTSEGVFRTAPASDEAAEVRFVVTTGHKFATAEDRTRGPQIYESMLRLDPDFFVHTGDVVYYDNDTKPNATNAELARLHWRRMYGLPLRTRFHNAVSSYFMKDDHDLLRDDCWPGQTYGELTFDRGVALFNEQTPSSDPPYRTFRWGRHLQIWLVEGREFRSANDAPDGPEKTIWGEQQKLWLKAGMRDSDATFRVLISPTPIVGPDRKNKRDNHTNANFQHEGDEIRRFLSSLSNTVVVCGDRHWQYVSVDDETKLREYSCGPSTDRHSGGWGKNDKRPEHQFLRVDGGFLSVAVEIDVSPRLAFRLHDTNGAVVFEDVRAAD